MKWKNNNNVAVCLQKTKISLRYQLSLIKIFTDCMKKAYLWAHSKDWSDLNWCPVIVSIRQQVSPILSLAVISLLVNQSDGLLHFKFKFSVGGKTVIQLRYFVNHKSEASSAKKQIHIEILVSCIKFGDTCTLPGTMVQSVHVAYDRWGLMPHTPSIGFRL